MTILSEPLAANGRYSGSAWAIYLDRLAFVALIGLALTFAFEAPLSGLQVGTASLSDSLTTVKILQGAVILLWLLSRLTARAWPAFPRRLALPVSLWLITLLLSTALAPDYLSHTIRFLSRIVQGLLLAWIAYDLVNSPSRWRLVVRALVIAGVVVACLGLAEAAGFPPVLKFLLLFHDTQTHVGDVVRISSSLEYATITAMVLEMLIPLTGAWLVTARQRWLKAVLGACIVVEVAAMALTLTRSAVLGLAAALIFIAVVSFLNRRRDATWAAAGIMGTVIASLALLLILRPTVGLRMLSESENGWYQARYSAPAKVTAHPDELFTIPLRLTNAGLRTWQAATDPVFRLGYTLSRPGDKSFVALDGIRTTLPADVSPGQTISLDAQAAAPQKPGVYLIQWDMVEENVLWFSWRGSALGSTQLIVAGEPAVNARPIQLKPAVNTTDAPLVERPALWGAALRILRAKPLFGSGPDNFRWIYGRYLNLDHWDTAIHANSIYFETLADTGLIGLVIFLWLNWRWLRLAWQNLNRETDNQFWVWQLALIAALIAWFVHGLLDYFYEFAGTYVVFWLIAGLSINLFITMSRQQPPGNVEPTE